jgi:serine/threonine protein kinase/WD40 repeat protein
MKPLTKREIFFEALEIPTPEARAAYLQAACGGDVVLRRKVEELLKEHFSDDSLLAGSALEGERASEARPPASEAPAEMIGRYKLLEKIGEGGFGEVWMAEQREPVKRRVALKIIKLGMDSRQFVARFEAERQALAMMDHPNIARIFDAGVTENGRPYFVMELVHGLKITDYCDQNQLPTRERLKLFILVCQAIQHAHQKGIIHRDIKPSNVLVTLHDGVAVPKVIDFGIAKATQQELTDKTLFTNFQQFIGTPAYVSPEQAELSGLDVDTRADIYSLGVLLYELLVGQTPFDAKEMMRGGLDALRQIIREKEPLRPSTRLNTLQADARTTAGKRRQTEVSKLVHQLQGDLDWIVMKCLEKDRARRYETANGLAADIQRHLANEPVIARPPSAAYKFRKAWQRNKLVFTAGVVVAVALVAGIGVSTWQAIRATRATKGEFEQRVAAQTAQTKASESEQRSRRLLYAADMNLAQQSLNVNNLGKALRLLDRHRPLQPGEEDVRGWEWRYLWQLTRSSALRTLTNRPMMQGTSVSFSPDGKILAVGWRDGRVELWDVPSRRWARALTDRERPHHGLVAFSPARNLLAATSEHRMVTLYDLDSGGESILWRAPDQAESQAEWEVRDLAFSQDGSKLVIFAGSNPEGGDAVWVVNVSSFQIESRHPAGRSHHAYELFGAARLSPDNRRLYLSRSDYLNNRYRIECIDLGTRQELWQTLWQTGPQTGWGLTVLDISPDGRVLASGSGFRDTTIHIWDAATGELLKQLDRHTGCVYDLAFTRDGRRLISAALDQTIRFWDTSAWTETQVLRGHTDEVWAIAVSEPPQLIASVSKDGDLKLWRMDETRAADGYRRLPESLGEDGVQPLDHSRVLLLPSGQPPQLVDLKRDSPPVSLPEIGSSANVLGCFGTNLLCLWNNNQNGTNQVLVGELRDAQFVQHGAIALDSDIRPTGFACNPARQLLAWTEGTSSTSLYLARLATPGRRIELTNDVPGLVNFYFNSEGRYLAGTTKGENFLRVWNVESGQIVARINRNFSDARFAGNGSVLVVALHDRIRSELAFYDLARPDREPQRVPGGFRFTTLAVSPDGGLVSATPLDGRVLLLDPATGRLIDSLRGHLIAASRSAFSPDGRRLFSPSSRGQEAVKLWDVGTRQELLTLASIDSTLYLARWSADGNAILAGPPWQAWSAPSWEEIAAVEAKDLPSSDFGGQGKTEIKHP